MELFYSHVYKPAGLPDLAITVLLQFNQLQSNMRVESEFNDLSFQLSDASLQLLPEYHQRVEVGPRLKMAACSMKTLIRVTVCTFKFVATTERALHVLFLEITI